MIIYLIVFVLSYIFAFFAEKKYKKNKKSKYFIFFSMLAVVIPSALAGLRKSGIGTDTKIYIDGTFRVVCNMKNLSQFTNYLLNGNNRIEPLYFLINFIVSRFSHNINGMYFVLQLVIMSLTYAACIKISNDNKFSMPYLIFLLLYYNRSLNICRQTIAISIVLFAFSYAWEQKFLKYFISVLIAFCFHKSAAIAIFIYWLIPLITDAENKKNKNKLIFRFSIFIGSLFILIFYRSFLTFLIKDLHIIGENYYKYVYAERIRIQPIELVFKIIMIPFYLVFNRYYKDTYRIGDFLSYFMIIDLILYSIGFYALDAQRLSFYFGIFNIFLIPQIGNCFKGQKSKMVVNTFFIMGLVLYWYWYYCFRNYHETYPYQFIFR